LLLNIQEICAKKRTVIGPAFDIVGQAAILKVGRRAVELAIERLT
jgi:hypothetical protein